MSTAVSLTTTRTEVLVRAPYRGQFRNGAKKLGGTWDAEGRVWSFPAAEATEVRALTARIYGTTGDRTRSPRRRLLEGSGSVTALSRRAEVRAANYAALTEAARPVRKVGRWQRAADLRARQAALVAELEAVTEALARLS